MSSVVALKQFPAAADGFAFTVLPGDVFSSTDYSAAGYAALVAAGAAVDGGNGFVSWDSPHPGLSAARAAVMELRAKGQLDPDGSNGAIMMLDGNALDASSDVTTGTATLVASTVDVTVTAPPDGAAAVPVGSLVYATVTTAAGKPKLLSAVRLSDTQIRISSTGSGYGALLESAGVAATLVAGTVDATLANVVGDRLSVALVTPAGTPGVLSVKRKSATEVTVESWLAGAGIEVLDTSDVKVYNFGQAAQETSLVRWAVVRPLAGA